MVVYQISSNKRKGFLGRFSWTTKLIVINVFFFILFNLLISLKVLSWGSIAIKPINILGGEYLWTFLTSMFMHAGLFHLFVNMISLFFVGSLIEKLLGKRRYLSFYLISGLIAGLFFVLFSLIFTSDLTMFAVGSSGAIFGLIGVLMFLTPNLPVYVMFVPIPIKMKYAAPGMLVLLWAFSFGLSIPIGNTAHLGGFIVGIFYGLYLKFKFPNKMKYLSRRFS